MFSVTLFSMFSPLVSFSVVSNIILREIFVRALFPRVRIGERLSKEK